MTSDEEPSEDASAKTSPPKSRFDEFLDRLDEREAARDRSGDDSDERPAQANREARETTEAEAETEADGWIWGSPKKRDRSREAAETPDGEFSAAEASKSPSDDEVIDRIEELSRASERDDERIWDAIDEESVKTAEKPSANEADISEDEEERTESENRWDTLSEDIPPSEERFAEGSIGPQTAVEPTEVKPSDESMRNARTSAEATANAGDPPRSEETTDGTTVSEYRAPSAEGALSGKDRGSLDRAVSAGSVLVLGPTGRPISEAICSKFLVGERGSRDVLFVTFDESPDDRVDVCHRSEEWAGGDIGIIEVGRGSRSSSVTAGITGGEGGSITVRHVSKPGDLSKLGIVITQLLAEFDETPRQTVLCFHTLSALHNQVGTKTLFRFLNTLQGRLRSANAVGHYHMDPDLHDEIVIETLRPIFDVIVRYTVDGDIEVQ